MRIFANGEDVLEIGTVRGRPRQVVGSFRRKFDHGAIQVEQGLTVKKDLAVVSPALTGHFPHTGMSFLQCMISLLLLSMQGKIFSVDLGIVSSIFFVFFLARF